MLRLLLLAFILIPVFSLAQTSVSDRDTISEWLKEGQQMHTELRENRVPRAAMTSQLISFYSRKHLGITYVGGLLEVSPNETLVVTLQGSDCVLFVEHAVAMAMTTMQGSADFEQFTSNLALFRYGDGIIDGYASRLHYFSDWLRTNQSYGRIRILFQDRGLPVLDDLSFMTENRTSYRQLSESDSLFKIIRAREQALNAMTPLRYIPQDEILEYEDRMETGDILTFVTTIGGLDISHTAIVKRDGNRVGFWHASTTGSVIVDPKSIYEYTRDRRNVKGIILARPVF